VQQYPEIYKSIWEKGHVAGNHTFDHINGWKTDKDTYLRNILKANELIKPHIFRPPYGRIKLSQVKALYRNFSEWKIYMWDVLSGDFDASITPQQCAENATKHLEPGSIVVFHDSEKAWERMQYALPVFLKYCREKNWRIASLPH
jgi:peptidoglycan/xylan/chitin deacetylase (PgdA/CDA1 family)